MAAEMKVSEIQGDEKNLTLRARLPQSQMMSLIKGLSL
jgi:hypothetical protein